MSFRLCPQRDLVDRLLATNEQEAHAGLVWNRYLSLWRDGASPERSRPQPRRDRFSRRDHHLPGRNNSPPALEDGTPRRGALLKFVQDYNTRSKRLAGELLRAVHARQNRVLAHLRGANRGQVLQRALVSRFATGLGGPHPTEIGFLFDRSVGVPCLPGSAVKGLARAAAKLLADQSAEVMFGPERITRDGAAHIGDLVFLDAYPATLPRLELDVITCHHSKYYTGDLRYPSETESPIPVYFLTVAAGTKWIFRIISRSGKHAARGIELLRFGLSELGAGAKTAVGYGSFAR